MSSTSDAYARLRDDEERSDRAIGTRLSLGPERDTVPTPHALGIPAAGD